MRSIAHQTVDELGGPGSVLARQRRDHEELDRLLHELDGTTGAAQEEVLTRIDRLVFSHAFAEETVLWPVLRRVLPDGEALTLRVEQEHQEVNELVAALERDGIDHPQRANRLARLVEVLREGQLRRVGLRGEVLRRLSPTRPHPTVSRRPPGNALSGLPLTLLDRTRDVVDAGARRAPEQLAALGRAVSTGLAGLAGLVEGIPLSRTGDRSPTSR
jgi:hypothetical protein